MRWAKRSRDAFDAGVQHAASSAVFGLSAALYGEITIKDGHGIVNRLRAKKTPAELALLHVCPTQVDGAISSQRSRIAL